MWWRNVIKFVTSIPNNTVASSEEFRRQRKRKRKDSNKKKVPCKKELAAGVLIILGEDVESSFLLLPNTCMTCTLPAVNYTRLSCGIPSRFLITKPQGLLPATPDMGNSTTKIFHQFLWTEISKLFVDNSNVLVCFCSMFSNFTKNTTTSLRYSPITQFTRHIL